MTDVSAADSSPPPPNVNTSNGTDMDAASARGTIQGVPFNATLRVGLLSAVCVVSLIGNSLVCLWMWRFWRRCPYRSTNIQRVNYFILNLTIADLCVTLFVIPTQIGMDCIAGVWYAGIGLCKVLKFLHTFSLTSSSYMVAAIAIDRYLTICRPLRIPPKVRNMIAVAWLMSLIPSVPLLFIFRVLTDDTGLPRCRINFANGNSTEANVVYSRWYSTGVTVSVFLVPFLIIVCAYTRLLVTIWTKDGCAQRLCNYNAFADDAEVVRKYDVAAATSQGHPSCLAGSRSFGSRGTSRGASLQPSATSVTQRNPARSRRYAKNATLPKAKRKTLRMTIAIVVTFILSCLPYFVLMIVESFGSDDIRDRLHAYRVLVTVMSITVASNSAVNPYIFLLFNLDRRYVAVMFGCIDCCEPTHQTNQIASPPPAPRDFYRAPPRNGPAWMQARAERGVCHSASAQQEVEMMAAGQPIRQSSDIVLRAGHTRHL